MRLYSREWVSAFNRAASDVEVDGEGARFRVLQIVEGAPEGTVRVGLASDGGPVQMVLDPPAEPAPQVTVSVRYEDAVALSRGELDPGRLLAAGRVKVRGDLAALVAAQTVLAAVTARLDGLSADAED